MDKATARAHFVSEILKDPDSDEPRLVYADWLEEHGEPRAEFIRCQVEAARLDWADPRHDSLTDRADKLLERHGAEWFKGIPDTGENHFRMHRSQPEVRRGFLEVIQLEVSEFDTVFPDIHTLEPITELLLVGDMTGYDVMSSKPAFQQVKTLDVTSMSADGLRAIEKAEVIPSLSVADPGDLEGPDISSEACQYILGSQRLRDACGNLDIFGSASVTSVSGRFASLKKLGVRGDWLREDVEAPCLTQLSLGPAWTRPREGRPSRLIADRDICPLLRSANFPNLSRLEIWGGLRAEEVIQLVGHPWLENLQSLSLHVHGNLDAAQIVSPTATPNLTSLLINSDDRLSIATADLLQAIQGIPLQSLRLSLPRFGKRAVELICDAKSLDGLELLSLVGSGTANLRRFGFRDTIQVLDLRGLRLPTLADFPTNWPRLSHLRLGACRFREEDLCSVLARIVAPSLRGLSLGGCGDKTLRALAAAEGIGTLGKLDWGWNKKVSVDAVEAVLERYPQLQISAYGSGLKLSKKTDTEALKQKYPGRLVGVRKWEY